jgi:hypothetical protein
MRGQGRGVTYLNYTSDQFTGLGGLVIPGTIRDSVYVLEALLEQENDYAKRSKKKKLWPMPRSRSTSSVSGKRTTPAITNLPSVSDTAANSANSCGQLRI